MGCGTGSCSVPTGSGDFEFLNTEGTKNDPVTLQVRDTTATLITTTDFADTKRSLTLRTNPAGNGARIVIPASTEAGMQFHGPNSFEFYDSVVSSNPAVATLGASTGDLMIKGDLLVTGANIDGGTGASLQVFSDGNFRPRSNSGIKQMIDFDNTSGSLQFEWFANGAEAAANKLADLSETGNLRIHGTLSQNVAFDLAETFLATGPVEPGDLVAVDPARPNAIVRTHGAGDPLVLGVVSARPGVVLGSAPFDADALGRTWGEAAQQAFLAQREALAAEVVAADPSLASAAEFGGPEETAQRIEELALERFHARATAPVALAGRVPVKVDARYGAIAAGDPLTPSPLPGIAMKAVAPGPIIGTALQPLASGSGRILAFVHRGWYGGNGATSAAGEAPLAARSADAAGTSAAPLAVQVAFATPPAAAAPAAAPSAAPPAAIADAVPHSIAIAVDETVEAGDVVANDAFRPGSIARARAAADPGVLGIVAGEPGTAWSGRAPLALAGSIVACKVDASFAPIRANALLVASPTPGAAMAAPDGAAPGTILGKAIDPLDAGLGTIRVLVMTQ